jgi:DNA polymerase V
VSQLDRPGLRGCAGSGLDVTVIPVMLVIPVMPEAMALRERTAASSTGGLGSGLGKSWLAQPGGGAPPRQPRWVMATATASSPSCPAAASSAQTTAAFLNPRGPRCAFEVRFCGHRSSAGPTPAPQVIEQVFSCRAVPMPSELCDLPLALPLPYRSSADPDGLDLNVLLVSQPLTTFFMRVHGQRLHAWGVREGDLLLVDRAIEPQPGHLVVVAHEGRFLLRPLVVRGDQWQLAALGPREGPIPMNRADLLASGLFGVAVQAVHHLLRPWTRGRLAPSGGEPHVRPKGAVEVGFQSAS